MAFPTDQHNIMKSRVPTKLVEHLEVTWRYPTRLFIKSTANIYDLHELSQDANVAQVDIVKSWAVVEDHLLSADDQLIRDSDRIW